MRFTAAQPEHGSGYELTLAVFAEELAAALAVLVPEARMVELFGGLRFVRGNATAALRWYRPGTVTVVLRQGCERVLGGGVPVTPAGLDSLAADLVGFFCGAPIATLAMFPHPEQAGKQPQRRARRRGPYDAPLVPLPFEPPVASRRR
jgi:hypothetical protein